MPEAAEFGARGAGGDRTTAPLGRRLCTVTGNGEAGLYRLLEAEDREGPEPAPGQFYMLATAGVWGSDGGRPYLARAFSVCRTRDRRLAFLVDAIGPGTSRLAALAAGEGLWVVGPLGIGFSPPPPGGRAVLVGGGVGIAPLVILSEALAEADVSVRTLLGFRSAAYAGAAELIPGAQLATDDGSAGHAGLVTDLLVHELARQESAPVVYACGPPAMLEAIRALCSERGIPGQLALEEAMACGFGACFGCVVPTTTGYRRICVDGPVIEVDELEESWHER